MRRMLAFFLSFCMVLSMVPGQGFAADETENVEGAVCTEHSFTVELEGTRTEPTCIAAGSVIMKCANCDATQVRTLAAEPDKHSYKDSVVAPDCTTEGYTEHICEYCNNKVWDTFLEPTGHSWQAASCTAPRTCPACKETEGEALGHADADTDHICDREGCGAQLGAHADENKDHKCDYGCAEVLGEHADADKNHLCDYGCAEVLGEHADADKNHLCDYGCTEAFGEHADIQGDGDHICDYCGTEEILTQCSGGTATCLALAVCQECGQSYGESGSGNHTSDVFTYIINENGTHTACHACCEEEEEKAAHTYENGLCVCGKKEPAAYGDMENGLYWELNEGHLTIFGTGAIAGAPWKEHSTQIEKLTIADGVTVIGANAFSGCTNLKALSFPGTARVEAGAFGGCGELADITVTGGAMWDYDAASGQNLPWYQTGEQKLTVKFAQGVTSIGAFSFYNATNVAGVMLPDSLAAIGDSAFSGSGLAVLCLPAGVETIGAYALANLKNLQALTIPAGVKSLGEYALSGSAVQAVELPSGLTAISKGLFKDCAQLNMMVLPGTVTAIGEEAFYNCKALSGVIVPEGIKVIEKNTFRNCVLNNVSLPATLTTIGEFAFAGNENLTKLTIPENVSAIEKNAFSGCGWLDTLVIQSKAFAVKDNAFTGCEKLKKIYYAGTAAEWKALLENVGTGNNSLKTASVSCSGDGSESYTPVQEVQIYYGEERVDGRILLIDLNKTQSITLCYKVLPENATNAQIAWTSNETTMTASELDEAGNLILANMKPGDMTLFAQNFSSEGPKEDYTFTTAALRLQFRKLEVTGDHNGLISLGKQTQLKAEILGDKDYSRGILWHVENGSGKASIDQNGVITGEAAGDVTVTAQAADGSGLAMSIRLTVQDYSVSITGPETVASGKSITLKAQLVPSNISGTSILWKLADPEDVRYITPGSGKATATAEIKLTAKKGIQEKHEVVLQAYSADGQAAAAEITVTVVPVTSSVAISREGAEVTGQTVSFDLNWEKILSFTATTLPEDAGKQVKWTVSDTKGTYVNYTTDENGTITLTPTGKTGKTITLTATASDGSSKKATVKVQLIKTAQSIEILTAPESLRAGSKVTLTTNLAKEEGLTDRNVVWSLDGASLPYASISDKGVLTTYTFPDPVTITVYAAVKANPELKTAAKIQLLPGAQKAVISRNGVSAVKNEILYVSVNTPVTLAGSILPENAIQKGTWKVTGKGVSWTDNGDGTATVTMTAAKTATLTFTAADGSKKSTSVKVQGVQAVGNIEIAAKGNANVKTLPSGKSLQLSVVTDDGQAVKNVRWEVTRNPEAATVSAAGKVKAQTVYENTEVTVRATVLDGTDSVSAEYTLTIRPARDETLHVLLGGETVTGTTHLASLGAEAKSLEVKLYNAVDHTWTDVADAAITVSGKAVTRGENGIAPAAVGSSTVTAKYGRLTAKVTVKVVNPVECIKISARDDANFLLAGKTLILKAAVTGSNGAKPTVAKLRWSVDNTAAATVSASGALKAAKTLTKQTVVRVTAEATDGSGVFAEYTVTIYPQITAIMLEADGIVLNKCVREFQTGKTLTLTSELLPGDAMQGVTWSINKPKLAKLTVAEDGTASLTLLAKGEVTIKAVVNDGSKKTVSVKIKIL